MSINVSPCFSNFGIPAVFIRYAIFIQSACHVESTNRGKVVYSSHTTPSVYCRKAISLNGIMLEVFRGPRAIFAGHNHLYFNHVALFSILIKSRHTTSIIFSILASFISTHILTGTSGI